MQNKTWVRLAWCWTVMLWVASLWPIDTTEMPWWWSWGMHIVGYAVLAAMINLSCPRQGPSQAWALTLTCGMLIELAQAFMPQREAAWDDVVSNIMGAGLGVWLTSRRIRLALHLNRRKQRQGTESEGPNDGEAHGVEKSATSLSSTSSESPSESVSGHRD